MLGLTLQNFSLPPPPTRGGVPWTHKLRSPLVEVQGHPRSPLDKLACSIKQNLCLPPLNDIVHKFDHLHIHFFSKPVVR